MYYTFFTYEGEKVADVDSNIYINSNRLTYLVKEQVVDHIINLAIERVKNLLLLETEDTVSYLITRSKDMVTVNLGKKNRVFRVVPVLSLINNDNVVLNAEQRTEKRNMLIDIRNHFKKNKKDTLQNIFVIFSDYDDNIDNSTHSILKVVVNQTTEEILVLSYDTNSRLYYVSRLQEWSYNMIKQLHKTI